MTGAGMGRISGSDVANWRPHVWMRNAFPGRNWYSVFCTVRCLAPRDTDGVPPTKRGTRFSVPATLGGEAARLAQNGMPGPGTSGSVPRLRICVQKQNVMVASAYWISILPDQPIATSPCPLWVLSPPHAQTTCARRDCVNRNLGLVLCVFPCFVFCKEYFCTKYLLSILQTLVLKTR